jgi:hypothetical protein
MDLQELLDKQEIYDVLARHVRGENRDDKELWLQTFWPDSECHNQIYQNWPVGSSEDPDAWEVSSAEEWVEKYWYALEPPNPPFFNMLGQVLIEWMATLRSPKPTLSPIPKECSTRAGPTRKEATTKITH